MREITFLRGCARISAEFKKLIDMGTTSSKPLDVAKRMLSELDTHHVLYQEEIVYDIQSRFGEDFVYYNANGNLAITQNVLKAFREMTGEDVVWMRSDRYWRRRESYDEPGRQQSG